MTDPKYLPMMCLPLVVPAVALGPIPWWVVVGGVVATAALNTAAVLVNTYADRAADEVNFPRGHADTERFLGYAKLRWWITGSYVVVAAATVTMAATVSVSIAVIYTLGWVIATVYSAGPRLKRRLVLSRICMACGPAFAFAGGWALHRDLRDISPVVVLLFVAQGINLLLKDVPDAEGDRCQGVRTLFTGVPRGSLKVLLPVLWTVPYVLVVIGVLAGWLPERFLWLLLLWPFGLLVARSPLVARDQRERELVRELAQVYSTSWVLANLVLFAPTPLVVGLCAASAAFYLVCLVSGIDRRKQGHGLGEVVDFALAVPRRGLPAITAPQAR